jgi:hypothetical protein
VHSHLLDNPPGIDPTKHAVDSFSWGEEFRLQYVVYQLRHYVWITHFWGDSCEEREEEVCEVPSMEAARKLLASRRAFLLACSDRGELASAGAFDEITGAMLFTAKVLDGRKDGIWLITSQQDRDEVWSGQCYTDQAEALAAFATIVDDAAHPIATRVGNFSAITAACLRDRAARARATVARVALGDAIRHNDAELRAARAISQMASVVNVSREFLYRVLAGTEWTWVTAATANSRRPHRQPIASQSLPEWEGLRAAWIDVGVTSATEAAAVADVTEFLESLDLAIAGRPNIVSDSAIAGIRIVRADLDVGRLPTVTPDNAETNLSYVAGHFPVDIAWSTRMIDRCGISEWPERDWQRSSSNVRLAGHLGVIGITITVLAAGTSSDR